MSNTTLHLFKQNFKFSSAHFLIFDEKNAEKLHGHNYQVAVHIDIPTDFEQLGKLKKSGYFVDFNVIKKLIKELCDQWDEHVLLPAKQPDMQVKESKHLKDSLEVFFRERYYVFPKNEVVLLPITNTSVEQLSRLFADSLLAKLQEFGVSKLRVRIEETRGQGASSLATIQA